MHEIPLTLWDLNLTLISTLSPDFLEKVNKTKLNYLLKTNVFYPTMAKIWENNFKMQKFTYLLDDFHLRLNSRAFLILHKAFHEFMSPWFCSIRSLNNECNLFRVNEMMIGRYLGSSVNCGILTAICMKEMYSF